MNPHTRLCPTCQGQGYRLDSRGLDDVEDCPWCEGSGEDPDFDCQCPECTADEWAKEQ